VITLRRLDGKEFVVNADLIETVEATPDTVVTLTNGHKYVVQGTVAELTRQVIKYRRSLHSEPAVLPLASTENPD
jgi:flagellar protein FlbD